MDWVLRLIRESFSYMDGRIDPPSSMHRLNEAAIEAQIASGEVWVVGREACVFLTPRKRALYLGKLAVSEAARGQGLARRLIEIAEIRARDMGLAALELQARIELVENHAAFRAMGFERIGETAHAGYGRPTSLTFTKQL